MRLGCAPSPNQVAKQWAPLKSFPVSVRGCRDGEAVFVAGDMHYEVQCAVLALPELEFLADELANRDLPRRDRLILKDRMFERGDLHLRSLAVDRRFRSL